MLFLFQGIDSVFPNSYCISNAVLDRIASSPIFATTTRPQRPVATRERQSYRNSCHLAWPGIEVKSNPVSKFSFYNHSTIMETEFLSLTKTWHSSYPAIDLARPGALIERQGRRDYRRWDWYRRQYCSRLRSCRINRDRHPRPYTSNAFSNGTECRRGLSSHQDLHAYHRCYEPELSQRGVWHDPPGIWSYDVRVSNAGYLSTPGPAAKADLDKWWKAYETNVKRSLLVAQAFLRNAKEGLYLLHTTTGMAHAAAVESGASAYSSSKLAATKMFEYIALENPGINIANVQPSIVETALARKHAPFYLDDGKTSLSRRLMGMNANERTC